MKLSTEAIAGASSRRPGRTLAIWIAILAVSGTLAATMLSEVMTTDAQFTNTPESIAAQDLLEERLRGPKGVTEIFILESESATIDDPELEAAVKEFQQTAMSLGSVNSAISFYDTKDPSLVSNDGSILLVPVNFPEPTSTFEEYKDEVDKLNAQAGELDGISSQSFGQITLNHDFTTIAEEDLRKGELFGIGVALIVLVVVFGALVAGLLPIAMAIGAIMVALGLVSLVGQIWEFSFFVQNMISMMGLAVGIDYSLFIVSRYREERRKGREKHDAIAAAGATSNRAVFFSGLIVVLALIGMLLVPTTIYRSLAAGSIFVVLAAVAASMTLLPALLSLLGDRINKGRIFGRKRDVNAEPRHGFWNAVTHGVMRRPVISLVVGAGLLLAASVSYLDINTGLAGVSTLPEDTASSKAFAVLSTEFSGGLNSPVEIVVDGDVNTPQVQDSIESLQGTLASDAMFGDSRVETNEAGNLALISAPVNGDPSGDAAVTSIERVRTEYVPKAFDGTDVKVLVGGDTAFNKDFFDLTDTYMPIVFVFVLGLSFLLLMLVFRSIVVPIKAILMNLLSVGAAYGLIVLVIQKGVGADLFGFQQVEAIEAWLPLFLFSVLFGLSMDYHLFLLSRIKEHFDHTKDNTESVAYGLRTTAGLITGAALIMVAVFAGFAAGNFVSLQQMGFGLAVAVFIDATIVRSVLVPASMKLLGDRNWYFPRWLEWLPQIHIEGIEPPDPKTISLEEGGDEPRAPDKREKATTPA